MAPSHESGGSGSSVHHADAARPGKKTPELTLDRTVALLQAVLPLPVLTPERSLPLLAYYLERNRIAQQAHAKTWKRKHKKVKYQAPL